MIGYARTFCNDADEVDPALSDDFYTVLANESLLTMYGALEQRISPVTATDAGLTFAPGTQMVTATPTDWYEIVEAFRVLTPGEAYGRRLKVVDVKDILIVQDKGFNGATGIPERVAFEQMVQASSDDANRWNVYLDPVPSETTYIGMLVRAWPVLLADATDVPQITDLSSYTIARDVAAKAAGIFGEDEQFISLILRTLPDQVAAVKRARRMTYGAPSHLGAMVE